MNIKLRFNIKPVVRFVMVLALIAVFSLSSTGVSAKPQWQLLKLKNGMDVIVVENRSVPLVTVEMAVKNGAYTESPEYNGLSHLYEHMFFKSNEKSKAEGYHDRASELGMLSNATTREEVVNYFTTTINYGLREAMTLLRDSIRYPLFDKQELDQEIQIVIDELNQHLSNPFNYLFEATNQRLWYKYPSRKRPGGDPATVAKATPEMMRVIQNKFYIPNNSALIISGDVSAQEVFKLAGEIFGDWPRGEDPFIKDPIPRHPPLPKDEVVVVNQPVNSATIQISWLGPSTDIDAPGTCAADVFSFILSQPNSQFTRALVDTGLTTSGGINYYTQKNVGPISITAQASPEKLKAALKAINAEIAKFDSADYFTDEELASAKTLLDVNAIYEREKPSEYAHVLSFWWASSGLDYFAGYNENLNKVTREDLKQYVRQYIKNKNRIVTVMISEADQKRIGLTDQDLSARLDKVAAPAAEKTAPKAGGKGTAAKKPVSKAKPKP